MRDGGDDGATEEEEEREILTARSCTVTLTHTPSGSPGTVEVAGYDLASMRERDLTGFRRSVVGFVFQQFNLIPTLTAYQNVEAAAVNLLGGDAGEDRIGDLLAQEMDLFLTGQEEEGISWTVGWSLMTCTPEHVARQGHLSEGDWTASSERLQHWGWISINLQPSILLQ